MAKTPKHQLKVMRNQTQFRGLAVAGDFKESTTKKGKNKTEYSFGIKTNADGTNTPYVKTGSVQPEEVFFYSRDEKRTERVKFADRDSFNEEGYGLIGTVVGLEKDEKGKNVSHTLCDFDAPQYISEELKSDMPVFVTGEINYYSFTNDEGDVVRMKDFVAKKIYGAKDIDFEAEDFKEQSDFKQTILIKEVTHDKEAKDSEGNPVKNRFVIVGYVVTFSSIQVVEMVTYNPKLAKTLKKSVEGKAIDLIGQIKNLREEVEDASDDSDEWGDCSAFTRTVRTTRELVVTGALKDTLNDEDWKIDIVEQKIQELKEAEESFGASTNNDDWGDNSKKDNFDDTDDFPF